MAARPDDTGMFTQPPWVEAAARATGGRRREVPLAPGDTLQLLERRIGPFRVAGAPLPKSGTPIAAALAGDEARVQATLAALAAWFPGSGLSLLQVTSPVPPRDIASSRVERIENLEIDLAPDCEQLWARLSSLPKRMVRRAVRERIRIGRLPPEAGAIDAHRRLAEALFKAQGEAPINADAHYRAILEPPLSGHLHGFRATWKGRTVGSLLALHDGARGYYWDVAVEPEARQAGAGHLLVWAWMRWCKRHGLRRLDMIGPPEGGRAGRRAGIGRFKRAFGAEPVPYWVVYWYRPLAGAALDASRWLARWRGPGRAADPA